MIADLPPTLQTIRPPCAPWCALTLLALLLAAPAAHARIKFSVGNDPVTDNDWPAGSAAVANLESRIALWVGPPFGGGQHNFVYRGDTAAFQQALELFAQIKAPERVLIVHEGPAELVFLKDEKNPKADARYDWGFTVWNPKSYDRLYNDPSSVFSAEDPGGNFRTPVSPPRLDVYVGGAPAGAGVDWSQVEVPDGVKVVDERASANGYTADAGSVVRGRAADLDTGKPVGGARVVVAKYVPDREVYDEVAAATAGADGRFELPGVPSGDYRVHAAADGYVPRVLGYATFGKDTLKDYPAVTLAKPVTLAGTVSDTDGKPLRDVAVRADTVMSADGKGYLLPKRLHATTDAGGHFTLAGLPKGKCQLHAHAAGLYRLDPLKLYATPAQGVALTMVTTGAVRGKIPQAGGALTDGPYLARITPEGGDRVGSWGGSADVKADGSFAFDGVPPGRYTVTARLNPGPEIKGKDPNARPVEVKPGATTEVEIEVQ